MLVLDLWGRGGEGSNGGCDTGGDGGGGSDDESSCDGVGVSDSVGDSSIPILPPPSSSSSSSSSGSPIKYVSISSLLPAPPTSSSSHRRQVTTHLTYFIDVRFQSTSLPYTPSQATH